MAAVLKTVVGQPTGGSNPSPSANDFKFGVCPLIVHIKAATCFCTRRGCCVRVATVAAWPLVLTSTRLLSTLASLFGSIGSGPGTLLGGVEPRQRCIQATLSGVGTSGHAACLTRKSCHPVTQRLRSLDCDELLVGLALLPKLSLAIT